MIRSARFTAQVARILSSKSSSKNRRKKAPAVEYLEDRTVPTTFQWTGLGTTTNWDDVGNWGGVGFPNASGDVAQLTTPLLANATVNVDGNFTIGQLLIGDATGNFTYTVSGASGSLTLADPSGTALLSKTNAGGGADNINAPLILANNVTADDATANGLSIGGSIAGSGALTKTGSGLLTLPRSGNSFTSLIINAGTVGLPAGSSSSSGTATYTNSGSYTYSPASNDLIATLAPSAVTNGSAGQETTGGTNVLTDQSITANNANTYTVGNNASLTYTLPSSSATGFDITAINLYSGWNDAGRSTITITDIAVSTAANPSVFTVIPNSADNFAGGGATNLAVLSAGGSVFASGIAAVRIDFGGQQNGYVGYREIEVVGVPNTSSADLSHTAITINASGTFDASGDAVTVASIAGTGLIDNSGSSANLKITGGTTSTFGGTIDGSTSLATTIANSSTLVLNNANNPTYGSSATVSIGATLQFGDGATVLNAGPNNPITDNGTLAFAPTPTGSINDFITVGGTGQVNVNSGTLSLTGGFTTTGPVNVLAGATLSDFGSITNNVSVTSSATLGGVVNLNGVTIGGSLLSSGSSLTGNILTGSGAILNDVLVNSGLFTFAASITTPFLQAYGGTTALTLPIQGGLIVAGAGTTVNVSPGVSVTSADFSAGTGVVNATNPLTIMNSLTLSGNIIASNASGSGFTASGSNIAADGGRTLTVTTGTLNLINAPSNMNDISYQVATTTNNAGISSSNNYTHAIDFGTNTVSGVLVTPTLNGVQFLNNFATTPTSPTMPNTGTLSSPLATSGNQGNYSSIPSGSALYNLYSDFRYNSTATNITLTNLTPGTFYKVNLYMRTWDPTDTRQQTFSAFIGNSTTSSVVVPSTANGPAAGGSFIFDEDHPIAGGSSTAWNNLVAANGGFTQGSTAWVMGYVYQADAAGSITLQVNATQAANTLHVYGLTNQVVPFTASGIVLPGTAIVSAGAATVDFGGDSATLGAVTTSGGSTLTLQNSPSLTVGGIVANGPVNVTTSSIADTGPIKAAAGTTLNLPQLTLVGSQQIGSNDSSGSGTVSLSGKLILTGTNPIATVAGGIFATPVGGSSVTGGGLKVIGAAALNLGDIGPVGVESVAGNFNVDGTTASATFDFDFQNAGSFDQINATGTLNFTGTNKPVIHVAQSSAIGSAIVAGTYNLINFATPNAGLASNTFMLDPSTPGGPFAYSIVTTSTAVELVVVSQAPSLQWDTNLSGGNATTPIHDGSGSWIQGSHNFYITNGTPGPTTWDNAQTFDVTFGGNSPAQAGGTVTLTGPIVTGGQLNLEPVTSPYTFSASVPANTLTTVGGIRDDSSALITAPIKLADSQIWNVASGQTLTVGSVGETSSSGISKFGSGTLLFAGPTGTYTGGTTISAGTVEIGAANALPTAGGILLGTDSSVLLDLHGLSQTIGSLAGNGSVTLGSVTTNALTISGSAATTFAGTISGAGAVDILGSGTLTLTSTQAYTGATNINGGTLVDGAANVFAAGSTINVGSGGTLDATILNSLAGVTINISGTGAIVVTAPGDLAGATINVASGTTFVPNIAGFASGATINLGAGATLTVSTTDVLQGANVVVSGGTLDANATNTAVQSVTLQSGLISGTSGVIADATDVQAQAGSISATLGGTAGFVKTTSGTVTLTGDNTYSGVTTVSAGILQIGNGGTSGDVGTNLRIVDNGSLVLNRSDSFTTGQIISGTGSFTKTGSGTVTIGAAPNTYTGSTTIAAGTLQLGPNIPAIPSAAYYPLDGNVNDASGNNNNGTLVGTGATYGPGQFGQALTFDGGESITVPFSSSLNLNTYTVNAWVNFANQPAVGQLWGILGTRDGGDLFDMKYQNNTGVISIHGDIGAGGTTWLTTSADAVTTLSLNTWHMITYVVTSTGYSIYIDANLAGSGTYSGTPVFASTDMLIGNTGGGAEAFVGSMDDVAVYGTNLSSDQVAGVFVQGTPGSLGSFISDGSAVTIASGATFDMNGHNETIGSLAGPSGGTVLLNGATLSIGSDNSNQTFAGSITGAGGLVKLGSGTETLTGTDVFTGPTAVSAGSLIVNGSLSGSSAVSIAAGGVLGGTGTVGSVMNAGSVNPGSTESSGTLSVGNLTLGPGALTLDLSNVGPSDSVAASGTTVDITGSALSLNIGAINANETFTILSAPNATITGTFTNLPDNTSTITVGSVTFGITYSAHSIVLTAQNAGSATSLVSTVLNVGTPYINSSLASHQHSMVENVVYSFSGAVSLSAANFSISALAGTTTNIPTLNVASDVTGTVWTVTFSGAGVNTATNSIGDGEYELVLSGVPGLASSTYDFFRLLGDMDGNGTVNTSDFATLISTFLRATDDPLYLGADDFDGDHTIGTADFAQFTQNFLKTLPAPLGN